MKSQKRCPGISVSENFNTLHRLGESYFDLGNLQKAKEYLLKCLEMQKSFHGESSPGVVVTLHGSGIVYQERGNLQKAEEQLTVHG